MVLEAVLRRGVAGKAGVKGREQGGGGRRAGRRATHMSLYNNEKKAALVLRLFYNRY